MAIPLYDYRCVACDAVTEALQRPDREVIACPACAGSAHRQLSVPAPIQADAAPYYDHGLGTVIRSRAQRRALMRANGLVEKGTSHLHGAKGTIFSHPGQATVSVPPNGAHTGPLRVR